MKAQNGDPKIGQANTDKTVLVKPAYLASILSGILVWLSG